MLNGREMKSHLVKAGVSENLWACLKTTRCHPLWEACLGASERSQPGSPLFSERLVSCLLHGSRFTRPSFSLHQKPLQAWEHSLWVFCVLSLLINEILRPSQATTIYPSWDRVFKRPLLTWPFSFLPWFAHCFIHRHLLNKVINSQNRTILVISLFKLLMVPKA